MFNLIPSNIRNRRDRFEQLWNEAGWPEAWEKFPDISTTSSYPAWNVKKGDRPGQYVIEIALAGFKKDEISVTVNDSVLTITGKKTASTNEKNEDGQSVYIHKGIATRAFTRSFTIDNEEVVSADFVDGLLRIVVAGIPPKNSTTKQIAIR